MARGSSYKIETMIYNLGKVVGQVAKMRSQGYNVIGVYVSKKDIATMKDHFNQQIYGVFKETTGVPSKIYDIPIYRKPKGEMEIAVALIGN